MADIEIELTGMGELLRKLESVGANILQEGGQALYEECLPVEEEAKRRCPVAPPPSAGRGAVAGALRASIQLTKPRIVDGVVAVGFYAGGPAIDYAIAVHEHLSEHSPPSWRKHPDDIHWNATGTGPKFLENPITEAAPGMPERMGRRIDLNRAVR